MRGTGNLGKRGSKPHRVATDFCTTTVGRIFARTADRHLHQHGSEGCHDHRNQHADKSQRVAVILAVSAKEESEIAEHGNRTGKRRGDRHDQRVTVLHMRQFMRHDTRDFLMRQTLQKTGRSRDCGVFRVTAGRERIRLRVVIDIYFRHWQAGIGRKIADHPVEFRRRALIHFLGMVGAEHHLVRVPIGKQIHSGCDHQRDHHPAFAADQKTDPHEQGSHEGQKHGGAHHIHRHLSVADFLPQAIRIIAQGFSSGYERPIMWSIRPDFSINLAVMRNMQSADNDNMENISEDGAAKKPLSTAAQRALKEAEERRQAEAKANMPEEFGGRGGADPARFGDWEINGRAIDF
ncbi:hypothetical protein D3C73_524420 [compost metagenome]